MQEGSEPHGALFLSSISGSLAVSRSAREFDLFGKSKVIEKVRARAQSRLPADVYRMVD